MAAPLAFAAAGILFATSAGASRGADLRGGTRSDLADLIRAEERRADDVTRQVDRLRAEIEAATERAGADGPPGRRRAAAGRGGWSWPPAPRRSAARGCA